MNARSPRTFAIDTSLTHFTNGFLRANHSLAFHRYMFNNFTFILQKMNRTVRYAHSRAQTTGARTAKSGCVVDVNDNI